jgi:hypothetical protein
MMSDEERLRSGKVRMLSRAQIAACPYAIFAPEHYSADGTCKCTDGEHKVMLEWGYKWDGKRWLAEDEEDEA